MNDSALCRVVVLISGSGSNLQALIDKQHGESTFEIVAVISNKAGVKGLERAEQAGIPHQVLDHKQFADREAFDTELATIINSYQPGLIVLAGFMRILTSGFVQQFSGKMLNIHPSLLPKYQGLNTHQRALDAGDNHHGVTVHFVTEELDGGPAIIQAIVPVLQDDNAETLAKRVLEQEHIIYPMAVAWFAQNKIALNHNGTVELDNKPLPTNGYQLDTRIT